MMRVSKVFFYTASALKRSASSVLTRRRMMPLNALISRTTMPSVGEHWYPAFFLLQTQMKLAQIVSI
jgi:hypothetical protein